MKSLMLESSCLSVCPHGTTSQPWDGICETLDMRKIEVSENQTQHSLYMNLNLRVYLIGLFLGRGKFEKCVIEKKHCIWLCPLPDH
jgi:hypothetical protein